MSNKLTYACFISVDGANPVPLESLNKSELTACKQKMSERLSHAMSDYYTQHPDEYPQLTE